MQVAIAAAEAPSMRLNRNAAVKLSLCRNSRYPCQDRPAGGKAIDLVGLNEVATTTAIGPSRKTYTAATTTGRTSAGRRPAGRARRTASGRASVAVSDTLPPGTKLQEHEPELQRHQDRGGGGG